MEDPPSWGDDILAVLRSSDTSPRASFRVTSAHRELAGAMASALGRRRRGQETAEEHKISHRRDDDVVQPTTHVHSPGLSTVTGPTRTRAGRRRVFRWV